MNVTLGIIAVTVVLALGLKFVFIDLRRFFDRQREIRRGWTR